MAIDNSLMGNTPPIVKNIIIINALMLLATMLFEGFMISEFAVYYPESSQFKPHQIFTHMFMHGGLGHLFFNMYAVWLFGSVLETVWGGKKFLIYYLLTGLGAVGLHMFVMWLQVSNLEGVVDPTTVELLKSSSVDGLRSIAYNNQENNLGELAIIFLTPTVGASGAVFGLLIAYGLMFPNTVLQLIIPPVAIRAIWFVIIYGAIELGLGITGTGGNIAHFAHVGGMLFGLIIIFYWKYRGKLFMKDQM